MQLLLDSCPYLTVLSVADCTTLSVLALCSKQLKTLDVSRCIHISEMSLEMPGEDYFVCQCTGSPSVMETVPDTAPCERCFQPEPQV